MSAILRALATGSLVALAMSAIIAPNASATTGGHFTSNVSHTFVAGSDVPASPTLLSAFGRTLTCPTTSYTGTTNATTVTEVTITPVYGTPCNHSLGEAHINMNACDYLFTIGATASSDNTVHLNCPSKGPVILVTSFLTECEIEITPNQTPSGGVAYETATSGNPAKHHVTVNATISGIHAVVTKDVGFCPFSLGETEANGTLTGKVTMKGFETDGTTQVGITATGFDDTPAKIKTEAAHTLVTGSQVVANKYTFGVLVGSVECEVATFDGTIATQEAESVTLKPAYSQCEGLEREVTTHMNGCAYVLKVTGGAGAHGPVDIECPGSEVIETTVDKFPEGCTLTVGPQTAGGVVDYKEEGSGSTRDLLLTWTLEGIDYERDGCEIGGKGNNGTYAGSVTLKGENTSGEQKGIWLE